MSVYEAILSRRSIREFTAQDVDAKSIRSLIEAAEMAPTIDQSQPRGFAIVQNVKFLRELSDMAKPMLIQQTKPAPEEMRALKNPEFNIFYDASTLIVISASKDNPYAIADCWTAAENLMLAARGMALGSCVVGMALLALNNSEKKSALGISEFYEAFAPVVIGFPKKTPTASQRKRPFILSWIES